MPSTQQGKIFNVWNEISLKPENKSHNTEKNSSIKIEVDVRISKLVH